MLVYGAVSTGVSAMPTFAERLRVLMEAKGWSVNDLARESGLSFNTVKSYLASGANNRLPTLANARRLAKALECTVDYLSESSDL